MTKKTFGINETARRAVFSEIQKFRLPTAPNQFTDSRCPVPSEGRWPTSSTRGGMRWTRAARETSAACLRTAKSCRSDAPMLASSLREEAQMTVSNKPGHRGEREVRRKTIARGMPGDFRCTCGDDTRVLTTHCTRGCGCIGHPAFPAPSVYRGASSSCKTSGGSRRENAEMCHERKRAQHSHLSSPGLTGRPSIPQALMMESRGCGVLDRPVKPDDDSFFWLRATRTISLFRRLDPFRGASPQRVAMFGTEKTEMADPGHSGVGRRDGEDLRLGPDKTFS